MQRRDESAERVGVVGAGYVGTATAVGLLRSGHRVVLVDSDRAKVEALRAGDCPIPEPGVAEAFATASAHGTVDFSSSVDDLATIDVVLVCVPTPTRHDGAADLTAVTDVVDRLAVVLPSAGVIVLKSTVPPGTTAAMQTRVGHEGPAVVCAPEFLRQGHAVADVVHPDRIVVGGDDDAVARVARLWAGVDAPVVTTDPATAELAKYAANTFLATKVAFVDELAEVARAVGADVDDVGTVMGLDPRIGGRHLRAGPGFGGACLPKDAAALSRIARRAGARMTVLDAAVEANRVRAGRLADRVCAIAGAPVDAITVAVLGLAFKSGTPDLTASPSVALASALQERGATVIAHDPSCPPPEAAGVPVVTTVDDALRRADIAVLATDWPCYRDLSYDGPSPITVLDTRRLLDREEAARRGVAVVT